MNKNLLRFVFNGLSSTEEESKDIFQAIDLNTISKVWTPNGIEGTFSLPDGGMLEYKGGLFCVLNDWKDCKKDKELTPFELLTIAKFDSDELQAYHYLYSSKWQDRPIDNIVFTNNKFDAYRAVLYLKACGFVRISQANRDELKVYLNDKGVLRDFNVKSDTVSFLASRIKDPFLKNKLHSVRGQVVAVWQLLEGIPYDLQLDDRHNVYLPFKGEIAKVTANNIEFVGYDKLKLFVPVESMNHEFEYTDEQGMYELFLSYGIAGTDKPDEWNEADKHNIRAFMSSIGYAISTYKDPSLNKAIIYSDFGATGEERNGRRGKSLIFGALLIFRMGVKKGENEYDPTYRHRNDGFEEFHKLILLDELAKNFNYHSLFSSISGSLTCERKGKSAIEIPFKKSPKWLMATNFVVPFKSDEQSIIARYAEYQLKPFWSATNEPRKYFNANFFSEDWDVQEWNKFFSFIVRCIQVFLSDSLIEMSIDRKESRYLSYIGNNDAKVEELERIFYELGEVGSFTVSDFIEQHYKNLSLQYDRRPIWTHNTAKRDIDIWIEHHNLEYRYYQSPGGNHKRRSWIRNIDENIQVLMTEADLPF